MTALQRSEPAPAPDSTISRARSVLRLDATGRPVSRDARTIVGTIAELVRTHDDAAIEEILVHGFLRDREERYELHVAPDMGLMAGGWFTMGTEPGEAAHFCGETPCHPVELTPYAAARYVVTNELYGLLDQERAAALPAGELKKPVVEVTWHEAALFSMWMGCRLPSEAEWEYACGGGSGGQWCCADAAELGRHAWYSENSQGVTHEAGTRQANSRGLFDMHGNVWEWCWDAYDQDYYARSAPTDPVSLDSDSMDRVCRGGSLHSLAEMCRTRYRLHEPADFWASDLGFRLVRDAGNDGRRWPC